MNAEAWSVVGAVCSVLLVGGGFVAWLARVAMDLGAIRGTLETKLGHIETVMVDHENRIDVLEKKAE